MISRFGQLCTGDTGLTSELGRRLSQAYSVKDAADYGSVAEGKAIQASRMVADAAEFVRRVRAFIATADPPA